MATRTRKRATKKTEPTEPKPVRYVARTPVRIAGRNDSRKRPDVRPGELLPEDIGQMQIKRLMKLGAIRVANEADLERPKRDTKRRAPAPPPPSLPDDDEDEEEETEPPTRAELEASAKELGLDDVSDLSDEDLASLVESGTAEDEPLPDVDAMDDATLYGKARELGIEGRGDMSLDDLREAVREALAG